MRAGSGELNRGSESELSDEEIVLKCPTHECLDELFRRYHDRLRRCAAGMAASPADVDDLVQEISLRILRAMPSFRGGSAFSTWVYRVAHNTCVDTFRRERKEASRRMTIDGTADSFDLLSSGKGDPAELVERSVAECHVEQALSALPEDYRRIAVLRLVREVPNDQVAELLGVSVESVKAKLKRSRKILRRYLEEGRGCPRCAAMGDFRLGGRGVE